MLTNDLSNNNTPSSAPPQYPLLHAIEYHEQEHILFSLKYLVLLNVQKEHLIYIVQ